MPDHQKKENRSPGGGGFHASEGLLLKESPEELNDAGDQEGEEYKQDQGWDIGIVKYPFYIPKINRQNQVFC